MSDQTHPGANVPRDHGDAEDLALAARYAPRILLDRREPFYPLVVGYTVLRDDGYSPSFTWDRSFDVTSELLVPWPVLGQWIPQRIDHLLADLVDDEKERD